MSRIDAILHRDEMKAEFLNQATFANFSTAAMAVKRVADSRDGGEKSTGETELTYELPAAPADVMFDGSVSSWSAGDDLGNCASYADLVALVDDGTLPAHPEDVAVGRRREWADPGLAIPGRLRI